MGLFDTVMYCAQMEESTVPIQQQKSIKIKIYYNESAVRGGHDRDNGNK